MSVTLLEDRLALNEVRSILKRRTGLPTTGDSAYNIYVALLVVLIVVFPIARTMMIGLAMPEIATVSAVALTAAPMTIMLLLATLGLVLVGAIRGPVVPSIPFIDMVVASPMARAIVVTRSFRRDRTILVVLATGGAAVLVGGAAFAGPIDLAGTILFFCATAVGAWLLSLLWLIGQLSTSLRRTAIRALCVALLVSVTLSLLPGGGDVLEWFGPWGWASQTWSAVREGIGRSSAIAGLLLVLSLFIMRFTVSLLDALSYDDLASQARRWGTIAVLAMSGDIKSAANKLKAVPRRGRHWRVIFSPNPVIAIFTRDIVGVLRFPARSACFALATVAAGALLAYSLTSPSGGVLFAYAAPVVLYFAVGGWAEGLRFHASMIGSSSPFALGAPLQAALHALLPATVSTALAPVGALLALVMVPYSQPMMALGYVVAMVLFVVVLQAFSAFKGPMPIELLTPVPTALGDLSFLNVAFWLSDAVTIALIIGGVVTSIVISAQAPGTGLIWIVAVTLLMAWWASARVKKLARP